MMLPITALHNNPPEAKSPACIPAETKGASPSTVQDKPYLVPPKLSTTHFRIPAQERATKNLTPSSAQEKPYASKLSAAQLLFYVTENDIEDQARASEMALADWRSDQQEMEKLSKERIEKIKAMRQSEEQVKNWSLANQVFSFMTSFTAILGGIALIATGAGAVAGALMIIGGVLQITNQVMNMTGAWKKIADKLLPENGTIEQKRAVINWIQLSIAFFSIVVAGAGGILAGWSAASQAMGAGNTYLGSVITCAFGVTSIGLGIKDEAFKRWMASVKEREAAKAKRHHSQESARERFERALAAAGEDSERVGWAIELEDQTYQVIQGAV